MRTDDGYIIQKCLDGDSTAFGLLVDKYKKSIYALAYSRIHNHHDAQDVTQEVFAKAYKDLRKLKRWDSFMGWLYRITVNLCKNWQRSVSRRPDREFTEDQDPIILDNPSVDTYKQDNVYESIQEALDSLPEMYHEVLALHYLEDMSIKDMSRFLGISPRTIDRRLNEARIKLKEEMIAMMSIEYKQHGLPANFTFQIVEIVKRIRINPISKIGGLPWGLSLATGMIIAFLGFGSHLNLSNPLAYIMNSANAGKTSVIENGEIPVNVMDISNKPIFAGNQGDGIDIQNAFFMSPKDEGGTWTKKADIITMRGGLSSSVLNGKIYTFVGMNGEKCFQTVEEYDSVTDKWISKTNMSTARWGSTASIVNEKIYVIGGSNDNNDLSTLEEYDPIADKWIKKTDMPTARNSLSSSVVNGKIYAIGGFAGDANLSVVEEYDPVAGKWAKKADMPTIRNGLSTSVVNGKIYAIGGWGGWSEIPTVEEYDPITDKWVKKADIPTPRGWLSTSVLNGKIYAIGGLQRGVGLSKVEIYDSVKDEWTQGVDMSTGRGFFSASEINGRIYVTGGFSKSPDNTVSAVEEYTPEGWQSVVSPKSKITTKWGQVRQSK